MKKILAIICFIISLNNCAQNLSTYLPVDEGIKKGVLSNGLTYYIKNTNVVKDAASFYIIQNVGSILENDDQQGLAHFLEHMAFNGTENFKGKGILNTFQEKGLVFGRDINAYTSFDETVYNIDNVPTTPGLIDKSLLVLHDWCNYLLLTDEEIDAERGVIKEEWRTRQNGYMRLYQRSLPITFNHSKYAKRMPIGLMSIVEGFEYKALRDFYHDWYRTDLQAIAVVGDVSVNEIEAKIKKLFSNIPTVKNPRERYIVQVPENKDLLYSLGLDKEVSTAMISFGIRHKKSPKYQTVQDLKEMLLESMVVSMLTDRLSEVAQKPEASFLGTRLEYESLGRLNNVFSVIVSPKPNKQQQAFEAVLTEVVRAVNFGYTSSEIKRTIKAFLNYYETEIAEKEDLTHGEIIDLIKDDYLNNEVITDIEKEYEITKALLASFTKEDVHNTIKRLYSKYNRFLNVTGVEGNNNLTLEHAKAIMQSVESDTSIIAYTEDFKYKTLMSGINITEGSIVKKENNDKLESTTYTLSNGVTVHYKFTDKEKNTVAFKAISQGGKSLVSDEDFPSSGLLENLIHMSGLGDYSATELPKVLTGKTVSVYPGLGNTAEYLNGSSATKDVESMLQLAYLFFEKPRFDEQAFQVLQGGINNYLTSRSKNINEQIKDSIVTTLYGNNNARKRVFNQEYAQEIAFDKIKSVYLDRFENPADFEYFIVGDVSSNKLEPLLCKYIASLPTTTEREVFKDVSPEWTNNKVDEDIYLSMEDAKTNVNIAYKVTSEYNVKNKFISKALGDILLLRLTEILRENEGGAYSPSAYAFLNKEPRVLSYLSVKFDCNPDLAEKLIDIVHGELTKLSQGDIKQEDLDKTLTSYKISREQSKSSNNYDMTLLTTFYRDGYNMSNTNNFEDIINNITKKDIQALAKALQEKGKSFEIVFKPVTE